MQASTTLSILINTIRDSADDWRNRLLGLNAVADCITAGSIRRWCDAIERIDLAVSTCAIEEVLDFAAAQPDVETILAREEKRMLLRLNNGIPLQLWLDYPSNFGGLALAATGSINHFTHLQRLARANGFALAEDGELTHAGKSVACPTEEQIYREIGLPFITPELREDRGEIEAAQQGNLPELITREDLHADLHMHTNWSDGDNSIREMALTAIDLGHQVIAICDHSPLVCGRIYGKSIHAGNYSQQKEEIQKIRGKLGDKIRIVHGIEVDIRPDGTLDLEDEILQQFELVIASLHTAHDQPRETITGRLIKAIRHPCVKIIAHPSGRDLPGTGAEADWEQVFKAAVENSKVLEINSNPHHLDLNDRLARQAAEMGAKFSIDTDAHRASALVNLKYGVGIARKARLQKDAIITCLEKEDLLRFLNIDR